MTAGVEVSSRSRTEREDQRDQTSAGSERVDEERETGGVGETVTGDSGPNHDRDKEGGAEEFSCYAASHLAAGPALAGFAHALGQKPHLVSQRGEGFLAKPVVSPV